MNWLLKKAALAEQLSPEVARFVLQTLRGLEQENVFDAPGIICGVVRQMRLSESDLVRRAAPRTELLLQATFTRAPARRLGA